MANKVFVVFGGSGFIGTHLIRTLLRDPSHEVVCIDLNAPKSPSAKLKYVAADVRDLSDLNLNYKVDHIFNLAAVHTTPGHQDFEYFETNVTGALEVAAFARRHDCSSIIFTSSISVYGASEEPKTERSVPAPESSYGRSKLIAESIHRQWANESPDRRIVICRPAVIFGSGEGGNFTRLAKVMRTGFFVFPGRTDTIKACFYVGDLVDCLIRTLPLEDKYILFNGCYPDEYTISDIVGVLKSGYFPGVKTFKLPLRVVLIAASFAKPFSAAGLGVHPDRILKLVRSTDVRPDWLKSVGWATSGRLPAALADWATLSNRRFD